MDDLELLLLLLLGIVGVHQHTVYLVLRSTPGPSAWEASGLPPEPRPQGPSPEFAVVLRFVGDHAANSIFPLQLEEVLGWTEEDPGQWPGKYCRVLAFRVALCGCPECARVSAKWRRVCMFLLVINECHSLIWLAEQSAARFSTWANGFHSQQIEALCTHPTAISA